MILCRVPDDEVNDSGVGGGNGTAGGKTLGVRRHMEPITGKRGAYWAGVRGLETGEEKPHR